MQMARRQTAMYSAIGTASCVELACAARNHLASSIVIYIARLEVCRVMADVCDVCLTWKIRYRSVLNTGSHAMRARSRIFHGSHARPQVQGLYHGHESDSRLGGGRLGPGDARAHGRAQGYPRPSPLPQRRLRAVCGVAGARRITILAGPVHAMPINCPTYHANVF
jgi:hypothetical protein